MVHGLHGSGGAGAPPRLDLPLCSLLSRIPKSSRKPFLIFQEIRNSDCAEILTRFFSGYKLPCARSRAPTDVRGGHNHHHALGASGAPWCLVGCVGLRLR